MGGDSDVVSVTQALHPDLLMLKGNSLAAWDCLHQCVFALMNTEAGSETGDVVPAVLALAAVGAFDTPPAYPSLSSREIEPYTLIQEQTLDRPRSERSSSPAINLTQYQPLDASLTQFQPPVDVAALAPQLVNAPNHPPTQAGPDVGMVASPNGSTLPVNNAALPGANNGGAGNASPGGSPKDGGERRSQAGSAMVTGNVPGVSGEFFR